MEVKDIQVANSVLLPEIVALLEEGHTVTLRVKGYSMRPFLENGRDKALLAAIKEPKVGDAVLAEVKPKVFVLHRIVAIEGDNVTLRGDGNINNEYCKRDDVKGIALGFYRKGREKADMTDGKKWLRYSAVWMRLYPIRRYLLFIYRVLFKLRLVR